MKKPALMSALPVMAWAAALALSRPADAEQCVSGLHALSAWTAAISGNANQWPDSARKMGFRVDHTPENGSVIVYPPTYGRGINATFGHVAFIVDSRPARPGVITIMDSNGICKGNRRQCDVRRPDWKRVWVIHPKK